MKMNHYFVQEIELLIYNLFTINLVYNFLYLVNLNVMSSLSHIIKYYALGYGEVEFTSTTVYEKRPKIDLFVFCVICSAMKVLWQW